MVGNTPYPAEFIVIVVGHPILKVRPFVPDSPAVTQPKPIPLDLDFKLLEERYRAIDVHCYDNHLQIQPVDAGHRSLTI
jgi:hypothetical protein